MEDQRAVAGGAPAGARACWEAWPFGLTPQDLARGWARCQVLASTWPWRDPGASRFADWLSQYWIATGPPAPEQAPDAVSALAGQPDGIRWFAVAGAILGYVTDQTEGCYRVPATAVPPIRLA